MKRFFIVSFVVVAMLCSVFAVSEAASKKLVLAVWTDDQPTWENVIIAYEKRYPDVEVELLSYPSKEYQDKILVALAGGQQIDLMASGNVQVYSSFWEKKQLLALDEFIAADNFDVEPFKKSSYDQLFLEGKQYALPYRKTTWVLYYNKDLFDAAGVDYPSSDMTWAEFRELAKKMSKGEGNDKIWGTYIHTWNICWAGPALQTGATWMDDDLSSFIPALQLRLDLSKDGSAPSYFDAKAMNAHYNPMNQTGKVAMVPIGDWHVGQLRAAEADGKIDFDWDIVPMPHPEGVAPNTTWGMPTLLSVTARTKHPQEAWNFLKLAAGEEGSKIFAAAGRLPGYVSEENKKLFMGDGGQKPANAGIIFDQSVFIEWPNVPGISAVDREIVGREVELSFGEEERSAAETLEVIAERINMEFKK